MISGNAIDRAKGKFIFRQLFDKVSSTYSYILADGHSKEAVIIDPVFDLAKRDSKLIEELELDLRFALNTHVHADHITGTGALKQLIPQCKSVISKTSGASADVLLDAGQLVTFGPYQLEFRSTPGHTNGCVTYVLHSEAIAFTGDALLIRGCGRTDFQEGNPETLYESVHKQIFSLPDHYKLFPAHDYNGQTVTTVGEEKRLNPRLSKSKDDFLIIMKNLNLAYPKLIDIAVPANQKCGLQQLPEEFEKKLSQLSQST